MKKTVMFTALYIMLCACTTNANTSAQEEDTVAAAAQDSTLKITTIKHIYQEADANGNGFFGKPLRFQRICCCIIFASRL